MGHKKKRRGSKTQHSQEAVTPGRGAGYLERNRVAANRCRLKKKQESEEIQRILHRETTKGDTLLAEINKLKEEVWWSKTGSLRTQGAGITGSIYNSQK